MPYENQPQFSSSLDRFRQWLRHSITLRIGTIALLSLLLLIPLNMVRDLIRERESHQQQATDEVGERWGGAQTIIGPILTVPYMQRYKTVVDGKEQINVVNTQAHFLPETLDVDGTIEPEIRKRGVFPVVVYRSSTVLQGRFTLPSFADWDVEPEDIQWGQAYLSMGLTDLRGIRESVLVDWNGESFTFDPLAEPHPLPEACIQTRVPLDPASDTALSFSVPLQLNGSLSLNTVPTGKRTKVRWQSPWASPSYTGAFLPDHETGPDGFVADWTVLHLNRPFPQRTQKSFGRLLEASFGVDLLTPIYPYRKSERTVKYGSLVIGLTFLAMFLVQVMMRIELHPLQYLFVGLALSVFYVLLLALAEKWGFTMAYICSASATVLLIVYYVGGTIRKRTTVGLLGVVLAVVYGFLFVTLQAEEYALLIGSIGLFAALAAVMAMSRRVDWYATNDSAGLPAAEENE